MRRCGTCDVRKASSTVSPSQMAVTTRARLPVPADREEHVVDDEEQEHDPVGVRSEHDVPQRLQTAASAP